MPAGRRRTSSSCDANRNRCRQVQRNVLSAHTLPPPHSPSPVIFCPWRLQIGVPLDPACLYGTSPAPSQEQQIKLASPETAADADDAESADAVNEDDLGGFSQLSVVETMLDKGQGLEAGLQGVAMTRWSLFCV